MAHVKIAGNFPFAPPPDSFRIRIETWFDSFERFNENEKPPRYSAWKNHFLHSKGFWELWQIESAREKTTHGRKKVLVKRYLCKPEEILDELVTGMCALPDIPKEFREKRTALSKRQRDDLQLTGRDEKRRAMVSLRKSANLIERYDRILSMYDAGCDFRSKELAASILDHAERLKHFRVAAGVHSELLSG
jgi:hypothetical protein